MPRNKGNMKRKGGNARNDRELQAYRGPRSPLSMKPPPLQTGTVVRQWYRYRCNSNATAPQPVLVQALINACGAVASSTGGAGTTMYAIANAVRMRRVRAWCAAPVASSQSSVTFSTVSVDFDVQSQSITASALQFTDTTMSDAVLAFIDVVPPRGSFASMWHNRSEGGSTVCFLNNALSSIIDFELEWILGDDDTASNFASLTAVVAGHIYYPGIFGSEYVPLGRTFV